MRGLSILALALLSCGGAALAQVATERPPPAQMYDRRPTGEDFAENYPPKAVDEGLPGIAVLCCRPKDNRRLECSALLEWPRNQGFGAATIKLAESFHLSEPAYDYYRNHPREGLKLPIHWIIDPMSNANRRAARLAGEQIAKIPDDVCTLPAPTS